METSELGANLAVEDSFELTFRGSAWPMDGSLVPKPGTPARRAALIYAPANFGKTTEMRERAQKMRCAGHKTVFVLSRRMCA